MMTAQKIAVLDLGTNTFNLLLVKITPSAYYIFRNEKIPVKIGKDGINQGIITEEAQTRALFALDKYKAIINREKVSKVYGYATSAFRNAENGEEFRKEIERKTGFNINIIAGDIEAEFIYKGVKTAFDIGGDNALIVDIGGGSVEFIICNRNEIFWKHSFDIGAQRLLDWFHAVDPIPPNEISRLYDFFDSKLEPLKEQMKIFNPICLIGSSGTFDTLSEMDQHEANRFVKGDEAELPLTIDGFEKLYRKIISLNKEERLKIPGMMPMRADMIVVAACLVKYVIDNFGIDQIRVSAHSLKEGMISVIQQEMLEDNGISSSSNL
ncbi:MAG: Ppx/GppA family phosphatase [Cytophagales bacterium]|nr:Ppx/GppA family phosphatase [Cytophagales bacterium]